MKPYPLDPLKNFTVPVIELKLFICKIQM
jgi:hypothetical protein